MSDLDLDAILARSNQVFADAPVGSLSEEARQHFVFDVNALIAAVRRLEKDNNELVVILDETRARMRNAEAALEVGTPLLARRYELALMCLRVASSKACVAAIESAQLDDDSTEQVPGGNRGNS